MNGNTYTAEEWEQWLRATDNILMFVDEDAAIHTMEVDEGTLTWLDRGTYGYDEETSRNLLEDIATTKGQVKPVRREDEHQERVKCSDGTYESAEEWASDDPLGVNL